MNNREQLIITIMHHMSAALKDRILLHGGMLLRLMDSHRATQDIDYILLSRDSKKVLAKRLEKILATLPDLVIDTTTINSRGIFIDVISGSDPAARATLKIGVYAATHLAPEHLSTVAVARQYKIGGRIVSTVALPEAFANKIAATLERDTARDLYDLSMLEPLTPFDQQTLTARLQQLAIARAKPKAVTFGQAAEMLREKVERLDAAAIEKELAPLLPPHQAEGMERIIKAAALRIAAKVEGRSN